MEKCSQKQVDYEFTPTSIDNYYHDLAELVCNSGFRIAKSTVQLSTVKNIVL